MYLFFFLEQRGKAGQGALILEASELHTGTHNSR
jgi:hypothetical protein